MLIKGRRGRETVCVVVPEEKMDEDKIALPANALNWLRLTVGEDRVKISQFPDIKNAKRVHVLPFKVCVCVCVRARARACVRGCLSVCS